MTGTKRSCSAAKCRKADTQLMVSCDTCKRWWHFSCANFDPSLYDTATPWFCGESSCQAAADAEKDADSEHGEENNTGGESSDVPDDLEVTLDVLMEAAAAAQASAAQKDEELAGLRSEVKRLKVKLSSVSGPAMPSVADKPSSVRSSIRISDERLEVIRKIQANHKALMENSRNKQQGEDSKGPKQSTPVIGTSNRRACFEDSSIQQGDMSSLLTILNRSNVQELPSFSGVNKREWPYFEEVFKSTTIEGNFSGKENVARLRKALKGEAYQLVSDRLKYSSDDVAIMDSLRSIFGRADVLVHGLTSDLLKLPPLKSKCDSNLHLWAVKVNGFVADLKSMKRDEDLVNGYVLTDLSCKLGASLYHDWRKRFNSLPRASLQDFAEFLTAKVTDLPPELVKPLESRLSKKLQTHSKSPQRVLTHQAATISQVEAVNCPKCGRKSHLLEKCNDFKSLSAEQRLSFVKDKLICFTCLDMNQHDWRACSRKKVCGVNSCAGRHHELLHLAFCKDNVLCAGAEPFVPQPNFNSSHVGSKPPILFKVVPIRIHGKDQSFVDTFAFLDDGSCLTMFEEGIFDELGLEGTPEKLTLQWTKGVSRVEDAFRTSLTVSGVNSNKCYVLKDVYSVKSLELPSQSVDVAALRAHFPHLRGLPLIDLVNAKPRILVGLDQAKFLLGHRQRHGKDEEPCALKTLLGWIVYGHSAPTVRASCFHQVSRPTMQLQFHDVTKGEDELHDLVKRHFSTEEFGVMAPKGDLVSREDSRAMDLMKETLKFIGNRYEIGLLWDSDNVRLPDSYPMALNRLISLKKSLRKKPHLLEWKNRHMLELVSKGYARIATAEDLERKWPRIWYAPTFIVENPNKFPPKPRDVADVAAKVKGVSLNSRLLKGRRALQISRAKDCDKR